MLLTTGNIKNYKILLGTKIYTVHWRNYVESLCAIPGFHCIWIIVSPKARKNRLRVRALVFCPYFSFNVVLFFDVIEALHFEFHSSSFLSSLFPIAVSFSSPHRFTTRIWHHHHHPPHSWPRWPDFFIRYDEMTKIQIGALWTEPLRWAFLLGDFFLSFWNMLGKWRSLYPSFYPLLAIAWEFFLRPCGLNMRNWPRIVKIVYLGPFVRKGCIWGWVGEW